MVLLDRKPYPDRFVSILASAVSPAPAPIWFDALQEGIYKAAVVGISRDALVDEITPEKHMDWRFALRNFAFKSFTERIKAKELDRTRTLWKKTDCSAVLKSKSKSRPTVLLILREGQTRKILNQDALVKKLEKFPVQLVVKRFSLLPLKEQICLVDAADMMISMHGAALSHVLFMRPKTIMIELFPFAFRKYIFQNLAVVSGVTYLSWQNGKPSQSKTRYDLIEANKFTNMTSDRIQRLPIDWFNMDSKNFWRNQDTFVDDSFLDVFQLGIDRFLELNQGSNETSLQQRFLIYTPWEQFNNQLLGFKSACALSTMFNRTLVLPMAGHLKSQESLPNSLSLSESSDYDWKPLEWYLDPVSLSTRLPCRTISFDNFYSLYRDRSIGKLRYHHISDESTSEAQFRDYYKHVVGLAYDKIVWDKVTYLANESTLMELHRDDTSPVLALGSMFWYYDFNVSVRYPLRHFYNYMENNLYHQITRGLEFSERLSAHVDQMVSDSGLNFNSVVAIHIRRGDYSQKCSEMLISGSDDDVLSRSLQVWIQKNPRSAWTDLISDNSLLNSCFTPLPFIKKSVQPLRDSDESVLYISTNSDSLDRQSLVDTLQSPNGPWEHVLFLDHLLPRTDSARESLDSIDLSIIDQMIAIRASRFIGNLHSSFSRHIIEGRILRNATWSVFR